VVGGIEREMDWLGFSRKMRPVGFDERDGRLGREVI